MPTSAAKAHISMASTPSAISSPAPAPTMPTPSTRSVFGSMSSLVRPSGRSSVTARPEAAHGNLAMRSEERRVGSVDLGGRRIIKKKKKKKKEDVMGKGEREKGWGVGERVEACQTELRWRGV